MTYLLIPSSNLLDAPSDTSIIKVLLPLLESAVYTSAEFRALVTSLGMRSSMGRTGVCRVNAMAESLFSALKNERAGPA